MQQLNTRTVSPQSHDGIGVRRDLAPRRHHRTAAAVARAAWPRRLLIDAGLDLDRDGVRIVGNDDGGTGRAACGAQSLLGAMKRCCAWIIPTSAGRSNGG